MDTATWLRRNLSRPEGRQIAEAFVRVSTFVGRLDELDAETARIQLAKGGSGVTYVDDGWSTLVDGLAERARCEGASIRTHAAVKSIARRSGGFTVTTAEGTFDTRSVVLAVAPDQARKLLEPLGHRLALSQSREVTVAALDLALERLPNPSATFALGIDSPVYFSVHSRVARLAPEGNATVQLLRYDDGTGDERTHRGELEAVLDRLQPGWRSVVVEERYLPRLRAASRLDMAQDRGERGRPEARIADGLFVAGDWVRGGSWLSDASLGVARSVGESLVRGARVRKAA